MKSTLLLFIVLIASRSFVSAGEPSEPKFRAVEIDSKIQIGYGLAVADIDGDKKPDILLADKTQIVWYRNPDWQKFVIAENLTPLDNVCIAAMDIDGDGKAEVAVGAGWNPSDTVNSGAVFYLIAPADRTKRWEAVKLPHEPTVHRMRWVRNLAGRFELVVVPLHGRGNKNGEGAGVKILSYQVPGDPHGSWMTTVVNDALHLTHNFEPVNWTTQAAGELLVASKEGVFDMVNQPGGWKSRQLTGKRDGDAAFAGAGEVRSGKRAGTNAFIAAVEPMHGTQLVVYTAPNVNDFNPLSQRQVLDTSLKEGHALACGDFLGIGSDQIVVGWRAKNDQGKVGLKLFTPLDQQGKDWRQTILDDNTMACEDVCVADLNGDGNLDIVASGRATMNVKVYFNERKK